MQQEFQWPVMQAFAQLSQANMQLFASTGASPVNAFATPTQLMQGMARNYAQFLTDLNASALSLFSGTRGMVDYFVKE